MGKGRDSHIKGWGMLARHFKKKPEKVPETLNIGIQCTPFSFYL